MGSGVVEESWMLESLLVRLLVCLLLALLQGPAHTCEIRLISSSFDRGALIVQEEVGARLLLFAVLD